MGTIKTKWREAAEPILARLTSVWFFLIDDDRLPGPAENVAKFRGLN